MKGDELRVLEFIQLINPLHTKQSRPELEAGAARFLGGDITQEQI
ncbi:hypothetical protein QU487_20800 [Crenobacter sp. SG2305]|nr:hypothetical protein [Crenobacter sp. SG2305]MDN0085150.1 hypothetical protein [Crenobacter sp. SG2305]